MDDYRRVKALGRGAYGTVYLLERNADGLQCVEKQIPVQGMSDKERADTIKEINVLKIFKHPNIALYYDSIHDDGGVHIVMEFAGGGTLAQAVKKATASNAPFDEAKICRWIAQMAHAMEYVHRKKILHRDIKSQNIFLDTDGNVKIGDFGLARVMSTQTANAQTVLGTPYYMSPELCEGKPYNDKSDVWSMGVLIYELVALKLPFQGNSLPALIMSIVRGKYDSLDSFDSYSEDLKNLIASLLVRDPKQRPSMQDILQLSFLQPYARDVHSVADALTTSLSQGQSSGHDSASSGVSKELLQSKSLSDSLHLSDNLKSLSMSSTSNHGGVIGGVYYWGAGSSAPRYQEALQDVTIRAVAVGKRDISPHYVAITEDGQALVWGVGDAGELGMGQSRSSKVPTLLESLPFVRQVSCGYQHTIAVTDTGEVYTWGRGDEGQLGNGSCDGSDTPLHVTALQGQYITHVSAGYYHCAVIDDKGQLYIWGKGTEGQLGGGVEGYDIEVPTLVPVISELGNKVVHVACGNEHTLCVLDNGDVYAWGNADSSRLGVKSSEGFATPKRVKALSGKDIVRVAAGEAHSMALSSTGLVYTWGENTVGQCGLGVSDKYIDTPTSLYTGLSGQIVIDIDCGHAHSVALTDQGRVLSWGEDKYGRLGHSSSNNSKKSTPKLVDGLFNKFAVYVTCGAWITASVIQDDQEQ